MNLGNQLPADVRARLEQLAAVAGNSGPGMATPDPSEAAFVATVKKLMELENNPDTGRATVMMGPYALFLLIGMIQLTVTHPGIINHDSIRDQMFTMAEQLTGALLDGFPPEHEMTGILAEAVRRGWDPARFQPAPAAAQPDLVEYDTAEGPAVEHPA